MNGTPRLRSAYPSTPPSAQNNSQDPDGVSSGIQAGALPVPKLPSLLGASDHGSAPLIPFDVFDAPTQRLYVSAFYVGLTLWRFYDYTGLVSDETDSLWLFMKWVALDGVFLYGLPGLRIPWLEWSSTTMTVIFLLHALLDGILMFRIPIPIGAWLMAYARYLYDRELAVSERRVKPASILHNSSLILGKQIIHILPEGSAMLNPDQSAFCIDRSVPSIDLPIRINQTSPILIELLRIDLETNANETIVISAKEARKLKKQADRDFGRNDVTSPRVMRFPIKKTGLYRLQKVVDESKLEVQRRLSDTLVVWCPSASVKSVSQEKCKGALSDFFLQVDAVPPLKIRYSKTINREDQGFVFLTIHPDNLITPLAQQRTSGALVTLDNGRGMDVTWARTQHIEIPINETLGVSGGWKYSIDEIHDACGNVANYSRPEEQRHQRSQNGIHTEQIFTVYERPRAALAGCSPQNPLKIAKGRSGRLPVRFDLTDVHVSAPSEYVISYLFTPQDRIRPGGEHEANAMVKTTTLQDIKRGPDITNPGLYTLQSVSTTFCTGEVLEPSSCLLLNPPEPDLTISAQNIPDKCAGNSVGLMVDLDLIGTPPFRVAYNIHRTGGRIVPKVEKIDRLRAQLELKPSEAGHYTYEFLDISDAVYNLRSLRSKNLRLEQDVKPSASARFMEPRPTRDACIEEPTTFEIHLLGEPPWTLEYELVHGRTRKKRKVENIKSDYYVLETEKLLNGGEHSLSLTSVTDVSGCKIFLEQEAKINVRHQRPKAAFGYLEGKRTTLTLETKKVNLPLRLSGEAPWTVTYRNTEDSPGVNTSKLLRHSNDILEADAQGTYQITSVRDASCPGTGEPSASNFQVVWIPRPTLKITESASVELKGDKYVKNAVCQGDQDALGVSLTGNPPYYVKYQVQLNPERGSVSVYSKDLKAGLGAASVKMDTLHAGLYEYQFMELSDHLYDHDRRKFSPLSVQQRVYGRPSATFAKPAREYKYCKEEETGDEVIPITLVGVPPFSLEIGIRHHATARPEIVSIPHIDTHHYDFHIPHRVLGLGTHGVTLRKVRDSHGCQRETEFDGARVQVNVVDTPSISPLESTIDYCVGDRISYTLSGTPPFNVFYTFRGAERKASVSTTTFRRIAETPGDFTVTAVSDKASTDACKARVKITKTIHELPSVRISKGRTSVVDIHEGGEAEILFEFGGTPPFEFTYTRSTNAARGKKSIVLETRNDLSHKYTKSIKASEEGTYEVVSIRDRYCGFSNQRVHGKVGQQLLTFK